MTAIDDPLRLQKLSESGLLQREVDSRLQILTRTAASELKADVSELNVITATEQRHAAWWPPREELTYTDDDAWPAETSACQIVVESGVPLSIPDTRYHNVCRSQPWAALYRGYLGVPVRYEGQVLGSLCVLTWEVRHWTSFDTMLLEGLARYAELSLPI